MGNDSSKESPETFSRRRKEEVRVFNEIIIALKRRLDESPTLQATARSPSFRLERIYAAEKKTVAALSTFGVVEGMLASVAAFVFLRRGPTMIGRLMERRSLRSGYRLDIPPPTNSFQQSQQQANPSLLRTGVNIVVGSIKLGVDVFLSLLVGASVSSYFVDRRDHMLKVSDLPLVEGRSLACDEFCTTIMQEVAKQHQKNPQFWKAITTNQDNLYLEGMYRFSKNCQKRQAYERMLRQEQGLSPGAPVPIPLGGVPADYQLEDGDNFTVQAEAGSNRESYFGESSFDDAESLFGEETMDKWGESAVTDRENDRK